jgi:hypothetical protein
LIVEHWNNKDRELPFGDMIIYPNGNITILNCYGIYDPNTEKGTLCCSPLCDTTIDSIIKYDADCWVSVSEWTSIDYVDGKIYGGDGAMGSDGFIACVDDADNLIWAMSFTGTNPIKSLVIKGNTLIAINEHSELQVEINLDVLTEIKMIPAEDRYFYGLHCFSS